MAATIPSRKAHRSGRKYYPTAAHEEAMARLDYLVTARSRMGLLVGQHGSGKTLALELATKSWRRWLHAVSLQNATALDSLTFLSRLATDWELPLPAKADLTLAWQTVTDAIAVHRCENRGS